MPKAFPLISNKQGIVAIKQEQVSVVPCIHHSLTYRMVIMVMVIFGPRQD